MKTQQDAVEYIRHLMNDLKQNPDSWENPSLDMFLDGAAAWLEDSGKTSAHTPSWELIINIFKAGKLYE